MGWAKVESNVKDVHWFVFTFGVYRDGKSTVDTVNLEFEILRNLLLFCLYRQSSEAATVRTVVQQNKKPKTNFVLPIVLR